MRLRIDGHRLPGRQFRSPEQAYGNVHVGVQERRDPTGLVAGDADRASWDVDVRVVTVDGAFDFRGPAVHGRRGERFVYLTWGDVGPDGAFEMFRRAKLMLDAVDRDLVRQADAGGRVLRAEVDLTDDCGAPRCARVGSPALRWSVVDPQAVRDP